MLIGVPNRTDTAMMHLGGKARTRQRPALAGLAVAAALAGLLVTWPASATVLSREEMAQIAEIRTRFERLLTDLSQTAQSPDLAKGDAACIGEARGALLQIAGELRSYEYLITIEDELNAARDDAALKGTLRFAVENAIKILDTERARMAEIADNCAQFPTSVGKAKSAIQFIEGTAAVLKQVQTRL